MDIDYSSQLVQLVMALERLAWRADEQRKWLEDIGTAPLADELGLEFDQWVELAPQLLRQGLLSRSAMEALARVNERLDTIDAKKELWDTSGLEAPEWERVREAAAEALKTVKFDE